MSFYHYSSSNGREGGKSYSPAEKKRRCEFYYDSLLYASYPAGILYLARHIRKDPCLVSSDREWLYQYAVHLFRDLFCYDLDEWI